MIVACRLAFALIALCIAPPLLAAPLYVNPLDAKLQKYIDVGNRKLPTMVTSAMRQEKVTVANGVLTYSYTVVTRTAAQLASSNISATQRAAILPATCAAPDTSRMLKDGISFRYVYYGSDGAVAGQVAIIPSDCR